MGVCGIIVPDFSGMDFWGTIIACLIWFVNPLLRFVKMSNLVERVKKCYRKRKIVVDI